MSQRNKNFAFGFAVFISVGVLPSSDKWVTLANIIGLGLAFWWPNLIPPLKGLAVNNIRMFLNISCGFLWFCFVMIFATYYIPAEINDWLFRGFGVVFVYFIFTSIDVYPKDKRKGFFSSDKVKALAEKMKQIHLPKPLPA